LRRIAFSLSPFATHAPAVLATTALTQTDLHAFFITMARKLPTDVCPGIKGRSKAGSGAPASTREQWCRYPSGSEPETRPRYGERLNFSNRCSKLRSVGRRHAHPGQARARRVVYAGTFPTVRCPLLTFSLLRIFIFAAYKYRFVPFNQSGLFFVRAAGSRAF
jgi:hypothetical protein